MSNFFHKHKLILGASTILFFSIVMLLSPTNPIAPDHNKVSAEITCIYYGRGAPEKGITTTYPDRDTCPPGGGEPKEDEAEVTPPEPINLGPEDEPMYSLPLPDGTCWDGSDPQVVGNGGASLCPPKPDLPIPEDSNNDGKIDQTECEAAGGTLTTPDGATQPICVYQPEEEDEKEIVLQCKAFGTGWIVCPLVEALASIGDGIIKNLIVPFLQSTPIDLENGESSLFKVWSTFRIIANIILVAALLFVVFGNAIGSGPAEAYLAKRSLPRIFIAAILINTSIYIAAAMVDITNILGKGIGQLLMAPFAGNGAFVFDIGAGAVAATTLLTLTSVAGAAVTVLAFQALVPFLALFVFIPAVIAMLATFMTLAIRQGILIFLIISAPVAFALFTLPNTAKYFSKWWGLFLKTLLVYPLIMVMIALANILAVMVNEANPSAIGAKTIKDLVSIILMLIPVFLVPFAFKMAGGIVSQAYNLINGTGRKGLEWYKGDAHNPYSNQSRIKRDATSAVIKERANAIKKLAPYTSSASNRNFLTRGLAKGATNVLGLGNIHRDRATTNKTSAEIVKELVDAGNEDVVRALFAERWQGETEKDAERKIIGREKGLIYSRIPLANGVYKKYTESDVIQAQQIVGKDLSLLQAFATHEFNKSYDDDDQKAYRDSLAAVANRMGLTKPELQGVWAGIKFKNKATRLEEKYRGISGDAGSLQFNDYIDARGFTEEFAEVIRQWDYHNFRPSTIKALRASMNEAEAQIAHFDKATAKYSPEQYQAIKANIDTIMGEVRSQLVWEIPESNEANAQIAERYSTPVGSARVDEEWRVMYDEWRAHNGNAVEELTPKFRERT